MPPRVAAFIEPMECLAVPKLPDGPEWVYETKLDGYCALAINCKGKLSLYSRKRRSFHRQYVHIFDALRELPENTVLDGEIVALDDTGRPNFNLLQHFRSKASKIYYFVFDSPVLRRQRSDARSTHRSAGDTGDEAPNRFSTNSHRALLRDLRGDYAAERPGARGWRASLRNGAKVYTRREREVELGRNFA
jgi:ATP dependent DNA ligase-like protein